MSGLGRARARLPFLEPASPPRRARSPAWLLYATIPALSALNAAIGLVLPLLIEPLSFGAYALATTLFQYGLIFDLGLSQTIDRRVPVLMQGERAALDRFVAEIMGLRLLIASVTMLGGAWALMALDAAGRLPFRLLDGVLSLAAGLSFMVALGAMSVWRARSDREAFAKSSVATGLALAVTRPVGLIIGGVTGSFALLFAAYGALAIALPARLNRPRLALPPPARALGCVGQSLPLFITALLWAVYMTANRWVVSFLAPPLPLGQFAFGANVLALVVGMVAAVSQLYYPSVALRVAEGAGSGVSGPLARDLGLLAAAGVAIGAAGIVAGPDLLELIYRNFVGAEAPLRILLLALPCLLVCSWLVPLGLATARRPWLEGLTTLPLALLTLGVATAAGYRLGTIAGGAWGSVAAACVLLALLLGASLRNGLLLRRHAAAVFAAAACGTALLALLLMLHPLTRNG